MGDTLDAAHPHDAFFKYLLEQPHAAAALLRERLSPKLVELLADDPPELVEGSFVDRVGRLSHSDRLFRMRLRDGRPLFVYCLVEHKSRPDVFVAVQLLRYLANVWSRLAREARSARASKLPPVVALVVYHGRRRWSAPRQFQAVVDAPEVLADEMLNFAYQLLDVGAVNEEELSRDDELRAGLVALKYGTRLDDQLRGLVQVLRALSRGPQRIWDAVLWYVRTTYTSVDAESFKRAAGEAAPGSEGVMESMFQRQVRAATKGQILLSLLGQRFGALSEELSARVQAAKEPELDLWFGRILEASSLDAVFERELQDSDAKSSGQAAGKAAPGSKGVRESMFQHQVRAQTKALLLLRQLGARFGSVPDEVRARVLAAKEPDLDLWLDRILEASSLAAVFET